MMLFGSGVVEISFVQFQTVGTYVLSADHFVWYILIHTSSSLAVPFLRQEASASYSLHL